MEQIYQIRYIALRLLEFMYLNCGADLCFKNLVCKNIINGHDEILISKSIKYLKDKNYITSQSMNISSFDGAITCLGIDWVEECNQARLYK